MTLGWRAVRTRRRRLSEELVECSRIPDKRPELTDLAATDSEELDSVLIKDFLTPHVVIVDEHGHEVAAGHDFADVKREVGLVRRAPGLAEEPDHLSRSLLIA